MTARDSGACAAASTARLGDAERSGNAIKPMTTCAPVWRKLELPMPTLALQEQSSSQFGFKHVKWLAGIEFMRYFSEIGSGYGGSHPDHEFCG